MPRGPRHIALALVGLAACSEDPGPIEFEQCVTGLPAPFAPGFEPPLAVTPAVLWTKTIINPPGYSGGYTSVAASDVRVVVTAGQRLLIYDHQGNEFAVPDFSSSLGPVALDAVGHIHGSASGSYEGAIFSLDSDGNPRFFVTGAYCPFEPPPGEPLQHCYHSEPIVAPDGYVYNASGLTSLVAYDDSGVERAGFDPYADEATFGIGDALIGWDNIPYTMKFNPVVINAQTGRYMGFIRDASRQQTGALVAGPELGLLLYQNYDADGAYLPFPVVSTADFCGRPQWELAADRDRLPPLLGRHDRIYLTERAGRESTFELLIAAYGADGQLAAGPTPMGTTVAHPIALGADGSVLVTTCNSDRTSTTLLTVSEDLVILSSLPITAEGCLYNGTLAEDGILFLAGPFGTSVTVAAVQTTSPGLLHTAWPAPRRDARATGWVRDW